MIRTDSMGVLVGRALWVILGPLLLFGTAGAVVTTPSQGWLTMVDFFYFGAIGAMVAGRWIEYASGVARDSFGEISTNRDVARYTIGIVAGGSLLWLLLKVIANYATT